MTDVEKVLLLQALQDTKNSEQAGEIAGVGGAVLGGGLGAIAGVPNHYLGQMNLNKLDRTNPIYQQKGDASKQVFRKDMLTNKIRPGARMAGSLVGALVGGGLGAGTAAMAQRESPSARMLAKLQTGQDLDISEMQLLENVLTNANSNLATLGMA